MILLLCMTYIGDGSNHACQGLFTGSINDFKFGTEIVKDTTSKKDAMWGKDAFF